MSKLIKASLKSAKVAIKDKNFEDGLKHSQAVLDLDSSNYFGLLFSGLCLAELKRQDEALSRFMSALVVDSAQTQTHQGIVKLFTKQWTGTLSDKQLSQLVASFDCLLKACSTENEDKKVEYVIGLCSGLKQQSKVVDAFQLLKEQLEILPNSKPLKVQVLDLIDNYKKELDAATTDIWVLTLLSNICVEENYTEGETEKSFQILLDILKANQSLHCSQMENFVEICIKLFDAHQLVRDVSFEILLQKPECGINWKLFESYEGKYQELVQVYKLIEDEENLEHAAAILRRNASRFSSFVTLWMTLSELHLGLNQFSLSEKAARAGLQGYKKLSATAGRNSDNFLCVIPLEDIKLQLTYNLAVSLSGLESTKSKETAVITFEKILSCHSEHTEKVQIKLIETLIDLANYQKAKEVLDKALKTSGESTKTDLELLRTRIMFMEGNQSEALEEVRNLSKSDPQSYMAHFLCGKFMWLISDDYKKDKSKCLTSFLTAAKFNVKHSQTFLFLGHYYSKVASDKTKGLKCYQKAYNLSPGREDTGTSLADILIELGMIDKAIELYKNITETSATGTCKWAWLRLGLCHLNNREGDVAIKCFQAALRADANDYVVWECLGEAFVSQGSYPAAWKSFDKARQLNPNSIFSIYQMAVVNQLTQQFATAVAEFEEALKISPLYVPAIKGLGQSHLSIARQMLQQGRDKTCVIHLNLSIQQLTKGLIQRPNYSCLWRLLGDCCSLVSTLNSNVVELHINSSLTKGFNQQIGSDGDEVVKIDKSQALELSCEFYLHGLAFCKDNPILLNDLGFSYYKLAKHYCDDVEKAESLANKSLMILKKAASFGPNNHLIWNNIGLVAGSRFCKKKALAQHSFIKSVKLEPNNWLAWCNLGVLYLTNSHIELAHQAFKTAQNLQPSFVNSWIGQALIAETIGSREAMDLFRHCTELAYHDEAIAGYAWWVCRVISTDGGNHGKSYVESVSKMKATIKAIPQMFTYCKRYSDCASSWTALGFLLEQDSLYLEAEKAFAQAYQISREVKSEHSGGFVDTAVNYARLLSLNSKHTEAVEICNEIADEPLEFTHLCQIAFVFSKNSSCQQAKTYYNKALELASTDKETNETELALAIHLWKSDQSENAKEILQQVEAYAFLCALALLEDNNTDLKTISWVMDSDDNHENKTFFYQTMEAYAIKQLKGHQASIHYLQRLIKRKPDSWELRRLLNGELHKSRITESRTVASIARETLELFDKNPTITTSSHYDNFLVHLMKSSSLIHSDAHCRSYHSRSIEAQKLVHRHPYQRKSWTTLAAAVQADHIMQRFALEGENYNDKFIDKIFEHITGSDCDNNDELNKWITSNRILQVLMKEKIDDNKFEDLQNQLPCDHERLLFQAWKKSIIKTKENNDDELVKNLQSLAQIPQNKYMVVDILQGLSRWEEAFQILNEDLSTSSDYLKLVKLSLDAAVETGDKKLWISERAANICEKMRNINNIEQHVMLVLQGLVKRHEGNYRKSRYLLNRAFKGMLENGELKDECLQLTSWYLYRGYVEKKDDVELEKLCEKWMEFDAHHCSKLKKLLPLKF